MLSYEQAVPNGARDGAPVAVLLHGRGAHRGDLQALHEHLPEGTVLVTPQAPHPGHPWGYGPGWAWYRYVAEDRLVAETLETSLAALNHFLTQLPGLTPVVPGPVFLGGFSQGGTTSLTYALRHPERLAGVLNFSGFLPADGIVDLDASPRLPIYWGHGRHDPNIPFGLAERGRRRLTDAGAEIHAADYEIGHWIAEDEIGEAADWMETVLSADGGGG